MKEGNVLFVPDLKGGNRPPSLSFDDDPNVFIQVFSGRTVFESV